ncbi:MAG: ABC transporter permease [Halanaerobiales bacterium]|nr:ABC transporter permease [Halanaerobiales bacterium]
MSENRNYLKEIINNIKESNLRRVFTDPLGLFGFLLILFLVLIAIFAPYIAPYSSSDIDIANRLASPSSRHLFGTDNLGRDVFSRLVFGSRIALTVPILTISFGIILAIIFGLIAGYSSERVGNIFLVIFDIIKSFPALLFAMTVIALTGSNLFVLIIIIGITRFPAYARLIRAQTLRVKGKEYVIAAKAIGASIFKIMYKHILPNVIGPIFIQAAMDIPVVITFVAALSFLGLGVPPPTPSWGTMIKIGYSFIRIAPWMVIFGGIALVWATLGFTLFGEALRDNLDPRLNRQR